MFSRMTDESGVSRRSFVAAAGLAAALTRGSRTGEAASAAAADHASALSVRQFGAAGDGVADDTVALQAAIEAAFDPSPTAPGALVIPPGTYKVSRTLRFLMRENCGRQRRISAHGARLRSAIADGGHVLHIGSAAYWHFLVIEGLEIAGSGEDGHGLYLDCDHAVHALYNSCLRDVTVSGCGGDGCRLYGNVFESQIVTSAFRGNRGNGATLAHSPHGGVLSSLQLFGCAFDDNEAHGAEIVRSYDVGFHGCTFRRNGRFGLLATNGCELVVDCHFDDNQRSAFDFENGGAGMYLRRYATLVGCVSRSTAKQTHLIDADLAGSFARLAMIGCRAVGEGDAAAAGLAKLRGATRPATFLGCQGAVTSAGAAPLMIGGAEGGGIAFAADWHGANLQLGEYRAWIDQHGRLRLKRGAPTADDDGSPVGTQRN
jgi:hypothetical protein